MRINKTNEKNTRRKKVKGIKQRILNAVSIGLTVGVIGTGIYVEKEISHIQTLIKKEISEEERMLKKTDNAEARYSEKFREYPQFSDIYEREAYVKKFYPEIIEREKKSILIRRKGIIDYLCLHDILFFEFLGNRGKETERKLIEVRGILKGYGIREKELPPLKQESEEKKREEFFEYLARVISLKAFSMGAGYGLENFEEFKETFIEPIKKKPKAIINEYIDYYLKIKDSEVSFFKLVEEETNSLRMKLRFSEHYGESPLYYEMFSERMNSDFLLALAAYESAYTPNKGKEKNTRMNFMEKITKFGNFVLVALPSKYDKKFSAGAFQFTNVGLSAINKKLEELDTPEKHVQAAMELMGRTVERFRVLLKKRKKLNRFINAFERADEETKRRFLFGLFAIGHHAPAALDDLADYFKKHKEIDIKKLKKHMKNSEYKNAFAYMQRFIETERLYR